MKLSVKQNPLSIEKLLGYKICYQLFNDSLCLSRNAYFCHSWHIHSRQQRRIFQLLVHHYQRETNICRII